MLVLMASCEEPNLLEPIKGTLDGQTKLQVLNAVPGTVAKFSLDAAENATAVPYAAVENNGYLQIYGGQRLLEFEVPGNPVPKLALRQLFDVNSGYTIFLTDVVSRPASGADLGGVRTLVVTDNLKAPAAGKAGIRFLNVAPGPQNLRYSLYNSITEPVQSLLPKDKSFTSKAGTISTLTNLQERGFREVIKTIAITNPDNSTEKITEALTGFTDVAAGPYILDARTSDTGLPKAKLQPVILEDGKLYTIFLYGLHDNPNTPLKLGILEHN